MKSSAVVRCGDICFCYVMLCCAMASLCRFFFLKKKFVWCIALRFCKKSDGSACTYTVHVGQASSGGQQQVLGIQYIPRQVGRQVPRLWRRRSGDCPMIPKMMQMKRITRRMSGEITENNNMPAQVSAQASASSEINRGEEKIAILGPIIPIIYFVQVGIEDLGRYGALWASLLPDRQTLADLGRLVG